MLKNRPSTSVHTSCTFFLFKAVAVVLLVYTTVQLFTRDVISSHMIRPDVLVDYITRTPFLLDGQNVTEVAAKYVKSPVKAPFKNKFSEMGKRTNTLAKWLAYTDDAPRLARSRKEVVAATESVALATFPFLRAPRKPWSETPLGDLRETFQKGSRGIAMAVGGSDKALRFAGHLIVMLRTILGSRLPIEIAYAGDADLSAKNRELLLSFDPTGNMFFLDLMDVFDDKTVKFGEGGWAIKPFMALASRFEQVIAMDSDVVFMQTPEVLFDHKPYTETGAYLFHDRLLHKNLKSGRHSWFRDQIRKPSAQLMRSRVWNEGWSEECDSGVVVLDKSRPKVLASLLHMAWQNTDAVRKQVTYRMTHGDKESWWLGLELTGADYGFEAEYGSVIGWEQAVKLEHGKNGSRVCSAVMSHTDPDGALLWYNGSLLKNKRADPKTYLVPDVWMKGGNWVKAPGPGKSAVACMAGARVHNITVDQRSMVEQSIKAATRVDKIIRPGGWKENLYRRHRAVRTWI
ncbi:hypothetical protein DCS_08132 [Drechmeria coniospora]|uniref:Uncharacterized protein n=1 Tax=Drechmeria coniospora TaxID=98403 RepID=A0A151GGF0_DRECN|nr:hypothetical protein DCS_08132 [Drechmeria coniospora]KYK56165.1 hypothetical protein DCS_08132 [Drechmeria coniospora]ODA78064.1 hypothetical protein RJ55_06667 [Drechmeria coniospora]